MRLNSFFILTALLCCLIGTAQQKYDSSQLKDAVKFARAAQQVDPYDYTISAFLEKIENELTSKVKNIYMDIVIE